MALYEAALATITGTGISAKDPFTKVLQLVLAVYSVAEFATLAGSLGAFLLRDQHPAPVQPREASSSVQACSQRRQASAHTLQCSCICA